MSDFLIQDGYMFYSTLRNEFVQRQDGKSLQQYTGTQNEIVVPEVKQLDVKCFFDNQYIKKVQLPNGLVNIHNKAFMRCENLESIDVPRSVEEIGDKAFWGCSSLKTVIIRSHNVAIGTSCFDWCTSLETMYFASPATFNKVKEQLLMAASYGLIPRDVKIKYL